MITEINRMTTTELEHRLHNYRYYPVDVSNAVHREYRRRIRNRQLRSQLIETFKEFDLREGLKKNEK